MKNIKKIDIHAHATAFPEFAAPHQCSKFRMVTGPELLEFYDKLNIEKGVLLPIVSPEGQPTVYPNETTKFVADKYPDKFFWFCNVDPRSGNNDETFDLGYFLEYYKKLGAKGVGEITSNVYADDPKMDNLFGCCAEADLPVTIHISPKLGFNYGIVDELGLPRLEKMLKKHPDLKLIGHSQPFWAEMSADLTEDMRNDFPKGKVTEGRIPQLMREYGNLYCDLSAGSGANALMRDPEYAAKFIEEFADRILYGCDVCATCNTTPYIFNDWLEQMVTDGMISLENYTKIVRGNAIRLLKL